jgi:DNA (cytosine-5)-methyltransferase 1
VFVVAHLGDWRRAAAVLFERASLSGHPAPRREAGQGVAGGSSVCAVDGEFNDGSDVMGSVTTGAAHYNRAPMLAFSAKDYGADAAELAPTLRAGGHTKSHANGGVMPAVAFHENQRAEPTTRDTAGSLKVGGGKPGQGYPAIQSGMQVRRLTPLECCRLQGFPDDYLDIIYRGKPAADGPKYKALGNSMAVPCMYWIGRRIQMVEDLA